MNRGFKGVWMPRGVYLNRDLNEKEKFLIVEIDSLDNENGCFANNAHFCEFLGGISERRLQQMLSKLRELKLISEISIISSRKRVIFSRMMEVCSQNTKLDPCNLFQGGVKDFSGGGEINFIHNNTSNNTINNSFKKHTKKEPSENQIVQPNEMVETESKIPSESDSEIFDKCFEVIWFEYSKQCKKQSRRPGNKKKSKIKLKSLYKNFLLTEIDAAIVYYSEDCLIRNIYLKNLENFLNKDSIEEWKDGSENHQSLLELKNKPFNTQNSGSRFESKSERMERDVKENRAKIIAAVSITEQEMDLPWLEQEPQTKRLV